MKYELLNELGLSEGQIAVYHAVLEIGIASIQSIQEKTGIERRNIYDILNKLIERGLITYMNEKGKRTYQCSHPSKIAEEIEDKQKGLQALRDQLPAFTSVFEENKPDIRAEVYRGTEAVKALMNEALEHSEIYWIGGNCGAEQASGQGMALWYKRWDKRRAERRVMMYDLVDHGTSLDDYPPDDIAKHKRNHYKYGQLPKDLQSPMVIFMFGNKVAQILWQKQSFAFVLESEKVKKSFMKYFHHFWKDPW